MMEAKKYRWGYIIAITSAILAVIALLVHWGDRRKTKAGDDFKDRRFF